MSRENKGDAASNHKTAADRKIKLVIIEDNASIRAMYSMKLKMAGFDVREARDGIEGLAVCEEYLPDIILLDLRMPEMSGDEMLERLRQTDWGASMRVVILTNISRDEAPLNLRFLGVDRYIVKAHITPSELVKVVQEII